MFKIKKRKIHRTHFPPFGIPGIRLHDFIGNFRVEYYFFDPKVKIRAAVQRSDNNDTMLFQWDYIDQSWHHLKN
jgi:hypothetical protein